MGRRVLPYVLLQALLLGLLAANGFGATTANRPPRALRFSWDTLPVFAHGSNGTGPPSDATIKQLARFSFVVVEKLQGACANEPGAGPQCDQEAAMIDVLRRVRQINPGKIFNESFGSKIPS